MRLSHRAVALVWTAARRELLWTWSLNLVSGATVAAQVLLVQALLAQLIGPQVRTHSLGRLAPLLVALATMNAIGDFASAAVQERQRIIGELTAELVQGQLLDAASTVDLATFEAPSFHDHMARATANASVRPFQVALALSQVASGLVGTVAVVVALARLQPWAALVIFAGGAPLLLAAGRNSRALYRLSVDLAPIDRERNYLGTVLLDKDAAKEVRAYQLAAYLRHRWGDLYRERIRKVRSVVVSRQRRALVANAVSSVFMAAALAGLLELVFSERISLATAGAAAVAVQLLAGRVQQLISGASLLYECSLFLEDVDSFVAQDRLGAASDSEVSAVEQVVFDHVGFSYPGTERLVLEDVSVRLQRGHVTAVVGENGAGKSTLVKLLCGLYMPDTGTITWDGSDAATLDHATLSAHVAVVFQDFVRYQLPAVTNIAVGRIDAAGDEAAICAAARTAGADDILRRLPHGYATVLSRTFEGGTDLSTGQWQRVALARLFFRDAPVVVLDEPTSALDPIAEHELFRQVRVTCADRAVLLISHRLSTVRSADHIYFLEHGRVVEQGSHDTLMTTGGRYAEMFRLQAAPYRDEPAAFIPTDTTAPLP